MCSVWGVCRKQLLALCIRTGLRSSRDTAFSFLLFLFLASSLAFFSFCGLLFLGRQSSVHRRVRPLLFSVGHFPVACARSSDNLLLRMFSPSLGNVSVSAPVELSLTFPRLLVLRLGLNSHSH